MKNLIAFEIRKVFRYKSFYICYGISLLILILSALITKSLSDDYGWFFSLQSVTLDALSNASFFMLTGIFVAIYVCDDNANHTLKNVFSRGYSRIKVYLSKYIVSLVLVVLLAALLSVSSLLLGLAFGGERQFTDDFAARLALIFLCVIGEHGVFFAISTALGRTGGSVALNLVGPLLLFVILDLLATLIKLDIDFVSYWLDSIYSRVTKAELTDGLIALSIVAPILYAGCTVTGAYFLFRRREV